MASGPPEFSHALHIVYHFPEVAADMISEGRTDRELRDHFEQCCKASSKDIETTKRTTNEIKSRLKWVAGVATPGQFLRLGSLEPPPRRPSLALGSGSHTPSLSGSVYTLSSTVSGPWSPGSRSGFIDGLHGDLRRRIPLSMRFSDSLSNSYIKRRAVDHLGLKEQTYGELEQIFEEEYKTKQLSNQEKLDLTWMRIGKERTHRITCCVVPNWIEADILLGLNEYSEAEDAEQMDDDYEEGLRGGDSMRYQNLEQGAPPNSNEDKFAAFFSDSVPSEHPSSRTATSGSTIRPPVPPTVPYPPPWRHVGGYNDLKQQPTPQEPTFTQSRGQGEDGSRLSTPAPEPSQSNQPPSQTTQPAGQGSDVIRIDFRWKTFKKGLNLDRRKSGEDFLKALQDVAPVDWKIDRKLHCLQLLQDIEKMELSPNTSMNLIEDDMEDEWDEAVEWITTYKRAQKPHVYVVLKVKGSN